MAGAAWWDSHFLTLDYGFGKSSASAYLHVHRPGVPCCFDLAACQAWAATPLSNPSGLALDPKGNL